MSAKHSIDTDHFTRRTFDVSARLWPFLSGKDAAEPIVAWLNESAGIEAEYVPANGIDYHSTQNIKVREAGGRWQFGTYNHWFVLYPDGSVKIMRPEEFEDEFVGTSSASGTEADRG